MRRKRETHPTEEDRKPPSGHALRFGTRPSVVQPSTPTLRLSDEMNSQGCVVPGRSVNGCAGGRRSQLDSGCHSVRTFFAALPPTLVILITKLLSSPSRSSIRSNPSAICERTTARVDEFYEAANESPRVEDRQCRQEQGKRRLVIECPVYELSERLLEIGKVHWSTSLFRGACRKGDGRAVEVYNITRRSDDQHTNLTLSVSVAPTAA